MSIKSVYAIVMSESQANHILKNLTNSGFSMNDISVLYPDKNTAQEHSDKNRTKAPEGALTGLATGGILGGTLGLLVGIGALAIPGVGPLIAAGPLLAALSGAAAGATVGGVTGSLIGLGMPEVEAKGYENRIAEGNILISVLTENSCEVNLVKDLMESGGAEDISVSMIGKVATTHQN